LKTLEKINRKAIRNSLENRKANSAQVGPLSTASRAPALACPRCLTGGSRLSAPTHAPSLPLSLAVPWARFVGAVPLAHVSSLSLCPTNPTCQLVPNLPPTIPCRGRAHDRAISGHLHRSSPLLSPAPHLPTFPRSLAPQPNPLALSLALCARQERSATAHRRLSSVLRPSSSPCPVFCLSEFQLAVSYSGPERFLRSRSPAAVDPRLHRTLPFSKRPGVRTQGEHPSHAFITPSIAPEPAQLLTGVSCAAVGLFPPWSTLSGAPVPVLRPRSCSSCRLEHARPFP
jgi:hypothetical protein